MNIKVIKIIGVVASVLGATASVVASWANEKKLDDRIATKVAEAVADNVSKD